MIAAVKRKLSQMMTDATLRRWMVARALGRVVSPPAFTPGHPPYLDSLELGAPPPPQPQLWTQASGDRPAAPIVLPLPGETVTLAPGEADALFSRTFADLETQLAVYRFAWLPLLGPQVDPAWVSALWQAWCVRHGTPGLGWDWHPYTAAERAINILTFARLHGLPGIIGDTLTILAAHGPAIAARLEYGGEHYTGNHLSNNGRGLYLLGLALGWETCAQLGLKILLTEAERIFSPSGVLREGSSHYHLLLTRSYISAWLAARGRPETTALEFICRRALAVLPHFALQGGLPLVGDISPDCPPTFLTGLFAPTTGAGWVEWLSAEERAAIAALGGRVDMAALAADGWLRADYGDFCGLWHASPQGWPFMPGHGHHDLGSFELHWYGLPLFIDPGRGGYGETGEAALYRSAAVHNLLQVDSADPTAANRPYYDDAFRQQDGGGGTNLKLLVDGVQLSHHGFRRQGVTQANRLWRFTATRLIIEDEIKGSGRRRLTRRLVTPWPVRITDGTAMVETPAGILRVTADGILAAGPITRWSAYGAGVPATAITVETTRDLPWRGSMVVEVI